MESMKAIVCPKYGPPDVLRVATRAKPMPSDDEVLIKIYATSVTNSDIFIRSSRVRFLALIPFRIMIGILRPRNEIIGQVFAGEIERAGRNVKTLKQGDKVYGLTGFSLGAYADFKTMKETNSKQGCISLMPGNAGFEEATSAAYGGLLALQMLEKRTIDRRSKILLYGASSTTGIFALQYVKHLGAEATCVCGEKNLGFIQNLGADKALDYAKDESIRGLERYDFAFDCVGKARKSNLRTACAGRVPGPKDFLSIDDEPLVLSSDRLARVKGLVENGVVKPYNDRVYDFDQIAEAHRYVELGHKRGNVAVTVNSKNGGIK
jgi:NADPH:quinone reductase-like Zn-dependent oxidoreductase